jgi:hypothetical protein
VQCYVNSITVSFSTDAALPAGTSITVTGLVSTQTASTSTMRVYGDDVFMGVFEPLGVWSQSAGRLVFTLAADTNHSDIYSINFDVVNPSSEVANAGASARLLRDAASLTIQADQVFVRFALLGSQILNS